MLFWGCVRLCGIYQNDHWIKTYLSHEYGLLTRKGSYGHFSAFEHLSVPTYTQQPMQPIGIRLRNLLLTIHPPVMAFLPWQGGFLRYNVYICICVLAADRQFCFENFLEKIFELRFGNGTIGFTRVHSIDSKVEQKKIYFWRFLTEPLNNF